MKKQINTNEAPAAIGPYSQAIESNGLLFISGQIPLDPYTTDIVNGDIEIQTRQVMRNIEAILRTAGYTVADIVKTTVFLCDLADFQKMNEAYAEFFTSNPARSTIEVSRLPRDARIEIEAIAAKHK